MLAFGASFGAAQRVLPGPGQLRSTHALKDEDDRQLYALFTLFRLSGRLGVHFAWPNRPD